MTLTTMCSLTPHLCRMAVDAAVRDAVAAFSALPDTAASPHAAALAEAMARFPEDSAAALTLLGGGSVDAETISRCFDREALAFFHICGQCRAGEMLAVLTRCTCAPAAEGLAALIGERRRMLAMARYGLQLLWRLCGDETIPDALALFPEDGNGRSADSVVEGLMRQLKGGVRCG